MIEKRAMYSIRQVGNKGVSPEFKKAFGEAVQHLNKHGASGMLAKLQDSKETYFITEGQDSKFSPKTKTITWNPTEGLLTTKGQEISPSTVLNHEADHALQFDQNREQYTKDVNAKVEGYDNMEEKRVITGSEKATAFKLGEIKEGEVTREDHRGQPYQTKGPTTTEWKNEVVVKDEKKGE